ncbi:protein FAR1-RELATED SEQUENCE 5-like [Tripterygium wilfordii]|uniref:protein FAR1-RELATED SEQUENCE 5-like n=1 Tax=Tripterygium wilfordii TaxID=458696 RepID=UPI0018F80459|nr:protein FAR1-RELATED SEQUENCE 5-like [Tripterygium wilfordii]
MKLKTNDDWMVRVVCRVHNHSAALYMEGHSYVGKLSAAENEILIDMSNNLVKPRNILYTLKNRDPNNVSTIKTIYNARQKFRTAEKAGKSQMQQLMSSLHQYEYVFFTRSNDETNQLEELFFAHPGSLELLRAFPHVLLMDATYKTNRFRMPLFEIVGVTSTKMTFCIGFVFLQAEKEDNYTWALNCLRSTLDESTFPRVIVTDRDLALMRSCAQVFPESMKLLCRWHIDRAVIAHCKKSFPDNASWDAFYSMWHILLESETENVYHYNLSAFEVNLQSYSKVVNYIKDVWLMPYKEMFITAWTDTYMHFGNLTTNRAESQHSKLKRYLGTSQSDLESSVLSIHQLIQGQLTAIKASLEKSKNIVLHRFKTSMFRELRGFVSVDALNLIWLEFERSKVVGEDIYSCRCKLRTSNGLPCAHELAIYTNEDRPIPLACIDKFWKKLDLLPSVSHVNDDIDCSVELQMFTEQFKHQSRPGKVSLLRKLREIINPSITALLQPVVKTNIRGRPSSKKKVEKSTRCNQNAFDFVQNDLNHSQGLGRHNYSSVRPSSKKKVDRSTSGDASAFEFVQQDFCSSQEPGRHSCSSLYSTPPLPTQRISRSRSTAYEHVYLSQFPPILHPYIMFVKDVRADGNYGFRAIAGLLGFGEDAWVNVRHNLIDELRTFWAEYVDLFGGYERTCSIYNSLDFWEPDRPAPLQNWMTMPDMGHLIASRYNVILHLLSSEQCLTFLPLRSMPPPLHEHVTITIGFVNSNHFVQIALTEGYPMPPIMIQWFTYRYDCAAAWVTPYTEQLASYIQCRRSTFPSETIVL